MCKTLSASHSSGKRCCTSQICLWGQCCPAAETGSASQSRHRAVKGEVTGGAVHLSWEDLSSHSRGKKTKQQNQRESVAECLEATLIRLSAWVIPN